MCDSAGGGTALVVNSICTLIGGLGGAALGAWWVSRNSEKLAQAAHDKALTLINKTHEKDIILMKQQEFSKAAAELRLSFSKIISGIRAGKLPTESDIRGFAQTSYDTHAIEIDRPLKNK